MAAGLVLSVRTPRIQTWLVQRVTSYLAGELKTQVTLDRIEIEFFRTLNLQGLYIEDLHHDTLLYAGEIRVTIELFNLNANKIYLSDIDLRDGVIKLQKYPDEKGLNFNFIVDYFSVEKTDTTPSKPFDFNPGEITLTNIVFVYRDNRYNDYFKGVDFEDIRVQKLEAVIDDIRFEGDSVYANIQNLAFTEKSGFRVEYLETAAKFSPVSMDFENMLLKTPETQLQGWITFRFESWDDFDEFIDKVRINSGFDESVLSSRDLVYFSSELEGLDQEITFSGNIKGTITQLRGKNLDIAFADHSHFRGDISIAGLPDFNESFFDLVVEELVTDKYEIESIPDYPFNRNVKIALPDNMASFGRVKFSGKFTGFLNDFVAYGNAQTAIGYITSDINLKIDEEVNHSSYSGHLAVTGFDVGKLTGNTELLGQTTFKAKVTGSGFSVAKVNAKMEGVINSLTLNRYEYKNIEVNAQIARKLFKGELKVNEENLGLDFNGTIDLTNKIPVYDFRTVIDHAKLSRLNLINRDTTVTFNTVAEINVSGKDIDEMTGYIRLGKTEYIEINDTIRLDSLIYTSRYDGQNKIASLRSDIVDFNMNGYYKRTSMFNEAEKLIVNYIPILKSRNKNVPNYFNAQYDLTFKETKAVTDIFFPDLTISEGTKMSGHLNSAENSFALLLVSDSIRYFETLFSGVRLDAHTGNSYLNVQNHYQSITTRDTLRMKNVSIEGRTNKNESTYTIALAAKDSLKTNLVIKGQSEYLPSGQIRIHFLPSQIVMNYKPWQIHPENAILIDSSAVIISNFVLTSEGEKVSLDGIASEKESDRLHLNLENFHTETLNPFLAMYDVEMGGVATGTGTFAALFAKPGITSDMEIKNLNLYKDTLGDAKINFNFLTSDKIITLQALVDRGGVKNIEVDGKYYIRKVNDSLDFRVQLHKTNLTAFSGYAKGLVSDIRGKATGELKVTGPVKKISLLGKVRLSQTSFIVDYLNTRYSLAEEVEFSEKYFRFKNFTVNDEHGNKAKVDGYLYHNHLSDFILDINIDAKNFQMLNTRPVQNELYYGTAYGTGKVRIMGPLDLITMNIAIKTEKNTRIFIPLSNPDEISRSSYINFINTEQAITAAIEEQVDLSGISMKFDLDVTPDAEMQLIFDSKIGDVIKGRGYGNIIMSINTAGDFKMYGNFQVVSGDYLFTLQNLLNKKFIINPGGTIRWDGSPYDATIDLEGVYKLKASLYDLIKDTAYTDRVPVEVHLHLSGKLFNPNIAFDIEVPDIDPTAETLINRFISTDESKSTQSMSLLVLNRFSPGEGVDNQGSSSMGVSANAAELLSQQLSVWASQISDVVDVGVNYRAADAFSEEELEVMLSTQLFNDRVSVDGNVGVAGSNSENTSSLIGDFNVEVKVSKDGRLRFKTFNKTINSSILNNYNSPYTQGVGIFYREEFDTLGELFRRYFNQPKKEEPVGAQLQEQEP